MDHLTLPHDEEIVAEQVPEDNSIVAGLPVRAHNTRPDLAYAAGHGARVLANFSIEESRSQALVQQLMD
ncbi:hypothetical protein K3495_g5192 [Podosphaera aphanis]|nr:hypothetical protein K3495_g5192 [Podosphaera aphanis]